MPRPMTRIAGISTLTQSHVISNDYKSFARFQGKSTSQFDYIATDFLHDLLFAVRKWLIDSLAGLL